MQAEQSPSLQKSPPTFLKPFVAGVCAALLAVSVAIPGWQFLTQPSPEEQHFTRGMVVKAVKTVNTEYRDELVLRGYQYSITSVSASHSCNSGIDCYD